MENALVNSHTNQSAINLTITSEHGETACFNVTGKTLDASLNNLLSWLATISGAVEVKGLLRE